MAEIALINGQAYDFTQVVFLISGIPVPSVSAITYTVTQAKENNYGKGTLPVSRGRGKKEFTGTVDISMNDVEALRDSVSSGLLVDIPAQDVLVVFGNIGAGIVTHKLVAFEFTDDGVETARDDTDVKRSFSFIYANLIKS